MQQQAIRRRQHDFEKHEQVEQVAGQEGAVDAHHLDLEQHMEMRAGLVPPCQRKHQRGQGHHRRHDEHQRRQPVQHQHDAKGHLPVGRQVNAIGVGAATQGLRQQQHRHAQVGQQRQPAQRRLAAVLAAHPPAATGRR
jgi:hypothetical protein